MKIIIVAVSALGLGLLPAIQAGAGEGIVVTLPTVAARVRGGNPELAAARLSIDEALGGLRQSGRLDNPELEAGFEHDGRFRERRLEIGFSQRFPLTERLRLEKQVSAAEVQAAEAEIRNVERELVSRARATLVRILAIREQRGLRRRQLEVSEELAGFIASAAARGELSPIDAGQAKLEAARFAGELRQLDAAEAAALGELKPLLGVGVADALHVTGALPPVGPETAAVDPAARADWQAARTELDAAGTQVMLEQAKRYDDIEVGLVAMTERTEDAPEGYDRDQLVGLRVKLPLPLWDDNEGNIDAARARQQRRRKELEALTERIRLEAGTARAEMAEWVKLDAEVTGTLLPMAEEQARLAQEAYLGGQGDLQAVLRAREQVLGLSSSGVDARREFHLARIRWLAAIGDGQGPPKRLPEAAGPAR